MSRRTPPNNRQAEESLLGAMLVSVNAIEVAAGRGLEPDDFYTIAHTHIYEAILRLHCKRHPDIEAHVNVADPETVSAELGKLLDECGGIAKLRQLQANAPSTGNALTFVRRIEKCKTLRDLLAAAGQIAELSYDEPEEVDEALERARAALRQVEERLPVEVPSGLMPLDDLLEWAEEQGKDFAPWLIDDLIKRQWRVLVVALPGSGKGLALDTPLPTPTGWTSMGGVQPGDALLGGDGMPCKVLAVSPVNHRPCYRVSFSDGAVLVADDQHLWSVTDRPNRRASGRGESTVVDTLTLHERFRGSDGGMHYAVSPVTSELSEADLPIDPYVLGAWLGDGTSMAASMASEDDEIRDEFHRRGFRVFPVASYRRWRFDTQRWYDAVEEGKRLFQEGWSLRAAAKIAGCDHDTLRLRCREAGVGTSARNGRRWKGSVTPPVERATSALRTLGVWKNKHIPGVYLRSSVQQRLDLLAGIVDTDGHVSASGFCEVALCNQRLAAGVVEVVRSLGWKATCSESDACVAGRVVGRRWRVRFTPTQRLPVVVARKKVRLRADIGARGSWRYVVNVEPVESVPTRCIAVDSGDHTFLAGRELVKTHNSTFLRQVAIAAAAGLHPFTNATLPQQLTVLIVDLENPVEHIVTIARPMRDGAVREGVWVHRKHCHVWHRPDGIDLTTHRGRADLEAAIRSVKPDLVVIGPAYKLANTDGANGNDVDAQVMTVLDTLRVRHDFGLMIETHPPHSDGMRLRVKGSSRWLNWPEIGLALTQIEDDEAPVDGPLTFELKQFRPGRLPTNWPKMVRHSRGKVDGWRPWVAENDEF